MTIAHAYDAVKLVILVFVRGLRNLQILLPIELILGGFHPWFEEKPHHFFRRFVYIVAEHQNEGDGEKLLFRRQR